MHWDLFCRVIDNHGDAGVCWRLARELGERGDSVRLWIDDPAPLAFMAPEGHPRVEVIPWIDGVPLREPHEVVVEAFGCDPPAAFVDAMARRGSLWINLEYLSAEAYVERSHGLASPVRGDIAKYFFYPGFTARTGGLLRERDLDLPEAVGSADPTLRVCLFCYEPPALPALLQQLAERPAPTQLLVTAGRTAAAVRNALPADLGQLQVEWLPWMSQREFDTLLASCDFNFVRGEDSLVRAIWAGRPFVWQLYPQADGAHFGKLAAFLDWLQPPAELRTLFRVWNGEIETPLPRLDAAQWSSTAEAARQRALALPELVASLQQFARARGRI